MDSLGLFYRSRVLAEVPDAYVHQSGPLYIVRQGAMYMGAPMRTEAEAWEAAEKLLYDRKNFVSNYRLEAASS